MRLFHRLVISIALQLLLKTSTALYTRARAIAEIKSTASDLETEYDYIIIGGGTSGLTVADRLTENPNSMPIPIPQIYIYIPISKQ